MSRQAALTYREYAVLPDDGRRYELQDGELSVTPAPDPYHQISSRELFRVLDEHVRARGLGEVLYAPLDVILSDTTVLQPDIVYLDRTRLAAISRRGIEGPPTLVVEILSPSTASIDRRTKTRLYARFGVPFYWLVDPEARTLEALSLGPDGYALTLRAEGREPVSPPPFEGLALVPAALWR
jgi:Uma2 family endonuclease